VSALAPALEARLVVCVGPGGVGKTSLSAALALAAAEEGKRVSLLTIDPARRLADALGLALSEGGTDIAVGRGVVRAAMLDTAAGWDAFVASASADADVRRRILGNRVYRAFSRTLARSHAYVAMERLYDVLGDETWDLVVLDTPPTRSALEILDAPARLETFADERIVRAFVGARGALGRPVGIAARRVIDRLFGAGLGEHLFEFFAAFAPLRAGFAERSAAVRRMLAAETTAFVLVAAASAGGDAAFLADDLARRGIALRAILFNRAFHARARHASWDRDEAVALLAQTGDRSEVARILDAALEARRAAADEDARAGEAMRAFARGRDVPTIVFPRLAREPCTAEELLALAKSGTALS
jgi:anion-transporting  ArsA/GET3 family ATPase